MTIRKYLPVSQFDSREALEENQSNIPNGRYGSFSLWRPRVQGIINGYRVEYGIYMPPSGDDGAFQYFFHRVKLKSAPQIPFYLRDWLPLDDSNQLFIQFGWLTRRELLNDTPIDTIKKIKSGLIPSAPKVLHDLMEMALDIDSGGFGLESKIAKAKLTHSSESKKALLVLLIGTTIVLGSAFLYIYFHG